MTDWSQLIRGEYLEIPGLHLTKPQVQRLWNLDKTTCDAVLEALETTRFLRRTPTGGYIKAGACDDMAGSALCQTGIMTGRLAPDKGDVVVRQQRLDETRVYVLHTAPGADQYVLRSREEAVADALTFAKREGVRAWPTDEVHEFARLEEFRDIESV